MTYRILIFAMAFASVLHATEPKKVEAKAAPAKVEATTAAPVLIGPAAVEALTAAPVAQSVTIQDPQSLVIVNPPTNGVEKILDRLSQIPILGPLAVEIAKWLGLIASIMTILVTAAMGIIKALQSVSKLAKLAAFAASLDRFSKGPVMYWLMFFSMYNAKKKDEPVEKQMA